MELIEKRNQKTEVVENWSIKKICKECGSTLKIIDTDVYCDFPDEKGVASLVSAFYVTCPNCNKRVDMDGMPYNVVKDALDKRYTYERWYKDHLEGKIPGYTPYLTKEELFDRLSIYIDNL